MGIDCRAHNSVLSSWVLTVYCVMLRLFHIYYLAWLCGSCVIIIRISEEAAVHREGK